MCETEMELEPSKKIEEIRSFSNKELRLTKEPRGTLLRSSDYCAPIRKKSYHCVKLLEYYIIRSSMRTYVIVTSIMNKLCRLDVACYRR